MPVVQHNFYCFLLGSLFGPWVCDHSDHYNRWVSAPTETGVWCWRGCPSHAAKGSASASSRQLVIHVWIMSLAKYSSITKLHHPKTVLRYSAAIDFNLHVHMSCLLSRVPSSLGRLSLVHEKLNTLFRNTSDRATAILWDNPIKLVYISYYISMTWGQHQLFLGAFDRCVAQLGTAQDGIWPSVEVRKHLHHGFELDFGKLRVGLLKQWWSWDTEDTGSMMWVYRYIYML